MNSQSGRQYGRGKSGGQVRDEYREDYDTGRGGWGMDKARDDRWRSVHSRLTYADAYQEAPMGISLPSHHQQQQNQHQNHQNHQQLQQSMVNISTRLSNPSHLGIQESEKGDALDQLLGMSGGGSDRFKRSREEIDSESFQVDKSMETTTSKVVDNPRFKRSKENL